MKKAPLKLQHVGFLVYHAISELNRRCEEFLESLEQVMSLRILAPEELKAYRAAIEESRALVNQGLAEIISDRELQNSAYYENLRLKWQGQQPAEKTAEQKGRHSSRKRRAVKR
jgi:hypothetical protein